VAADHLGVVLAIPGSVHCEFQVLEAVILGEEGHEGGQCVWWGSRVVEYLGQVGFAAVRAGDVLGDGDGQGRGLCVAVGRGHGGLSAVKVDGGLLCGGIGGGGRCLYRQSLAGFPSDHDAFPKLLVDATGVFPTLLVEAFTRTELHLLGQLDGRWHEVRENLVSVGQRGVVIRISTAAASRAVQARRAAGCSTRADRLL
jgi:hypothetical protein